MEAVSNELEQNSFTESKSNLRDKVVNNALSPEEKDYIVVGLRNFRTKSGGHKMTPELIKRALEDSGKGSAWVSQEMDWYLQQAGYGKDEGVFGPWEDEEEEPGYSDEDEDEYEDELDVRMEEPDSLGNEEEPGEESGEYEPEEGDEEKPGYSDEDEDESEMDEDEAMNKLSEMSRQDVKTSLQEFSRELDGYIKSVKEGWKAVDKLRTIMNDNEFLSAGEALTAVELIKKGVDPGRARGKNALKGIMKSIVKNAQNSKRPMEDLTRILMSLQQKLPLS